MTKFPKKGVLLFAVAMAVCAFTVPSVAGAATWDPPATQQTITSANIGFTSSTAFGPIVSSCTNSSFVVDVTSATTLEVTGATFGGTCTMIINGAQVCNMTLTGTRFPWTITAASTTDIRLDGVHIDVRTDQSGAGTCPAAFVGLSSTVTGSTTSGGSWDPTGDQLTFTNAEGIRSHSGLGANVPLTLRGSFVDSIAPRLDLTD